MNIANMVTLSRLLLTVLMTGLLFVPGTGARIGALAAFMAAIVSDYFDGYLARRFNMITRFGMIMDPIADKVLVLSALTVFVYRGIIPGWMIAIIVGREALVCGFRYVAARRGAILPAAAAGKWKTAVQMAVITLILIYLIRCEVVGTGPATWAAPEQRLWWMAMQGGMLVAIIMTVYSGITYLFTHRRFSGAGQSGGLMKSRQHTVG